MANNGPATVQLVSYNFITDTATLVQDWNNASPFMAVDTSSDGLGTGIDLGHVAPTVYDVGNPRTTSRKPVRRIFDNPRKIKIRLGWGGSTWSAWITSLHTLAQNLEAIQLQALNPNATPYCLKFQHGSSSTPVYADILEAHIPGWTFKELLAAQLFDDELVVELYCRPFFRGARQWLANAASNPGFEAPAGPAVTVFDEDGNPFANANAYAVQSGSTPTVASQVMTITSGTRVAFGSPAWGAINQWTIRWQYATGLISNFFPHLTDVNNYLLVQIAGTTLSLVHHVAGADHGISSSAPTLTNTNWYWLQVTQFPSVAGNPPYITANLYNDSTGTIGTAVTNGAVAGATFDAVTALIGRIQIGCSGASLLVGGNFPGVHTVKLFGPGGWQMINVTNTAHPSFAWDTTWGNPTVSSPTTYPNGPVTSFGAARIDAPPTGAWNAYWSSYSGGAPAGTPAIPVQTAGNVVAVSVWYKTSGCGASLAGNIYLTEFDASGNFLRQTAGAAISNVTSWTQLSSTVTTGASCAYVGILLNPQDATSGSANGTVWFDNVQCWDTTRTGVAAGAMPYCELVFPQSPAQLVVSGLKGDVPAPAFLASGFYSATLFSVWVFTLGFARRLRTSAGMQCVAPLVPTFTAGAVLDSTSYGGFAVSVTATTLGELASVFSTNSDAQGVYHALARLYTTQAVGNLPKVSVTEDQYEVLSATWANINTTFLTKVPGTAIAPFTAASTWTLADLGQVTYPSLPHSAHNDLTQTFIMQSLKLNDTSGVGPPTMRANWVMLLPVDAQVYYGTLNGANATSNTGYVFLYVDATGATQVATTASQETVGIPNVAHAGGAQGAQGTGSFTMFATADSFLTLDPTQNGNTAGVNQIIGFIADSNGVPLAFGTEWQYYPQYLFPL